MVRRSPNAGSMVEFKERDRTALALHPGAARVARGVACRLQKQRRWIDVAMETGPLELLAGERVLAVADAQNLNMGARDLGRKVSWKALGTILDRAAARIERHVVLSAPQGEDRRTQYFAERGWTAHVKQSRMVRNHKGWQRISNADGLLLFVTGMLAANSDASLVLVCSGDGELVEEVAEALYLQGLPLRVATLSLAGSTSARLDAACSSLVAMNLELGADCLRSLAGTDERQRIVAPSLPRGGGSDMGGQQEPNED